MTTTTTTRTIRRGAVWIDDEWDRANASNGVSRFVAYLIARRLELHDAYSWSAEDGERGKGDEAVLAKVLAIAQAPVMAPGYVCTAPGIASAVSLHWDEDQRPHLSTVVRTRLVDVAPGGTTWDRDSSGWLLEPRLLDHGGKLRTAVLPSIEVRVPITLDAFAEQMASLTDAVLYEADPGRLVGVARDVLLPIVGMADDALRSFVGCAVRLESRCPGHEVDG